MTKKTSSKKTVLGVHKATGQFCKKHKGRVYYFGADEGKALKRFAREWPDITQGKRRRRGDSIPLHEIVNDFLTHQRARVDSNELTPGSFSEYHRACGLLVEKFGRNRDVLDLRPDDFAELRKSLAKQYGPRSLKKYVTLSRALFGYAYSEGFLETPMQFGSKFEIPSKRLIRLARQAKGSRFVSAADCRKLLAVADTEMRAMILLALNAGYGQLDCANLQLFELTARPGWLEGMREKTATPRRAPLWAETTKAIKAVAKIRPETKDPSNIDCVFLTETGLRWVRYNDTGEKKRGSATDAVATAFKKLAKKANVVATFYDLRHTFRTVADEVRDWPAINLVMGHAEQSIASEYREGIADDRLQAVTNHVHKWLFG